MLKKEKIDNFNIILLILKISILIIYIFIQELHIYFINLINCLIWIINHHQIYSQII
jgi:hypothetical protein